MKKFKYNGYEYDVINIFEATDMEEITEYEVIETSKTILREKYAIFPYYVNGKFAWFKKVKLRYKLFFSRKVEFDDGWSYLNYWTKWKPNWKIVNIIN